MRWHEGNPMGDQMGQPLAVLLEHFKATSWSKASFSKVTTPEP